VTYNQRAKIALRKLKECSSYSTIMRCSESAAQRGLVERFAAQPSAVLERSG
jgi:hypothetical protein